MFASGERARPWAWALGGAAAVAHLVAEANGHPALAVAAKPIPALLLAAAVFLARPSALRVPVGAGLLASAIADVLIQLPGGFLRGLAGFLVAHLFYLSGFWRARREPLWPRAIPVAIFGLFMANRTAAGLAAAGAAFRAAVFVYIFVICIMLWRAAALVGAPRLPRAAGRLALGGAIAFAASDSLIAVHRFVSPLPWSDVPIMLLYWAGQCGIAFAAIRAGEARSAG